MAAAGFKVWFFDGYRSTPEASFLVRYKNCDCGIMITASHNPPTDNAVKVYWSTGGQLLPPHDENVIDRVYKVKKSSGCRGRRVSRQAKSSLPGGSRPGVRRGGLAAEYARTARREDHLLAAARRRGVGGMSGAQGGRISRR